MVTLCNVNTDLCSACECLDPNANSGADSSTTLASIGTSPIASTSNQCSDTCINEDWKGDNTCDDGNNNCGCEWDGEDCCGSNVNTDYCSSCECLDPTFSNSGCESHKNNFLSK